MDFSITPARFDAAAVPGTPAPHHDQARRPRRRSGAAVALALSGLMLTGLVVAVPGPDAAAQAPTGSFADLAERVSPAVVNISTTRAVRAPGLGDLPFEFPPGSPFEEFFRQFQDRFGRGDRGTLRQAHALGSGFIIDPAGYVVSNNHVIEGADEIQVTLVDGRQLPARVVGTDRQTDLALLKVDSDERLPSVAFGDSDAVRVGDWVIAVGNPFGLGGTVSAGIVSARGRDIHAGPFDDFLQLDVTINPGNSGGPTFDMSGKVVGVNTAIASPTGASVGIGFAIPSNLAQSIITQLKAHGKVERGWLGVQIQEMTPDLARALGLDAPRGALVSRVMPDGPAASSGIREGDVILTFDGKKVKEMRDLPRIVAETPVGKDVTIEVWRDGGSRTLRAEIARQPQVQEAAAAAPSMTPAPGGGMNLPALGATLATLSPELRQRFRLPEDAAGVVIVDLDPDGPAAEQGLRPGDIIEKVSQQSVETPEDVQRLVEAASSADQAALLLLVNRQGDSLFVALNLAA